MNNPFSFFNTFYNGNQSSKLVELLKNEEAKFEDILDEDALTQDFRDGKAHVVN